jgi:acetyl esterase/lipase
VSPPLTGQYISIPITCNPEALPLKYKDMYLSRQQNKDALVLNQRSIDALEGESKWRTLPTRYSYLLTSPIGYYNADPYSPLKSPLIFSSHENLPPAYFQICGADPLRDDGLIYEQMLREDYKIKTRMDIFPGLPHGFWSWFPHAGFTKDFEAKSVDGMKWLLQQAA